MFSCCKQGTKTITPPIRFYLCGDQVPSIPSSLPCASTAICWELPHQVSLCSALTAQLKCWAMKSTTAIIEVKPLSVLSLAWEDSFHESSKLELNVCAIFWATLHAVNIKTGVRIVHLEIHLPALYNACDPYRELVWNLLFFTLFYWF